MSGKIYCHLLLFCGILFHEIFASLSDVNNRLSSESLVRKRRVINHLPGGENAILIQEVPYIVKIKEGRRTICAGAILSHYTVITAAPCFRNRVTTYQVDSGAAGYVGNSLRAHKITSKVEHFGNEPHQPSDGIALLTVDPPFEFNSKTGYIELYEGPLRIGQRVTVFGWGHLHAILPGTNTRLRLRQITLPIMSLEQCRNEYLHQFTITSKNICTYCEYQYCAQNDEGAPLIVDNKLAGIHVYKGDYYNQKNPDVYLNFQRLDYRQWILNNTLLM